MVVCLLAVASVASRHFCGGHFVPLAAVGYCLNSDLPRVGSWVFYKLASRVLSKTVASACISVVSKALLFIYIEMGVGALELGCLCTLEIKNESLEAGGMAQRGRSEHLLLF